MTTTAINLDGSKSKEVLELFPELLPDTSTMYKRWIWKEDSNTLEQISTGFQVTTDRQQLLNSNKVKKTNRVFLVGKVPHSSTPIHLKTKTTSKPYKPIRQNPIIISPKPSNTDATEKRVVSLDDVKGVSYDLLSESGMVMEPFQNSLSLNHFDGLLVVILHYFDTYFQKISIEKKTRPMATEPSASEIQHYQLTIKKLEYIQKQLAEKYCSLILGLEGEKQHHMGCGRQRKSYTKKDRLFYETLYSFCCYFVWICFRRNHFELIQEELGRLFRSQAFNPYGRPTDGNEFKLASDLTSEEIHHIKLAPSSLKTNKRPPIQSIINQRSPVLVSLFPTSKESAAWLLDRRKALTKPIIQSHKDEIIISFTNSDNMSIGIIGEMMSGFNPFTLAPFGDENDDAEDEETKEIPES